MPGPHTALCCQSRAYPYARTDILAGKGVGGLNILLWKQRSHKNKFHPSLTVCRVVTGLVAEPRFSPEQVWNTFQHPTLQTPHLLLTHTHDFKPLPAFSCHGGSVGPLRTMCHDHRRCSPSPPAPGLHEHASEQRRDSYVQRHPVCPRPDSPEDQNRR